MQALRWSQAGFKEFDFSIDVDRFHDSVDYMFILRTELIIEIKFFQFV